MPHRFFPDFSLLAPRDLVRGCLLGYLCLLTTGLVAQQAAVVGGYPRDGARGLLRNLFVSIKLDFPLEGQGIDESTLTSDNVRLYPSGSPLTRIDSWLFSSDEIKNITLQPKELLPPNTTFVFEITAGLLDNRGLPFKPFRCVFATGSQGLDKPATAPPGYGSEPREFVFEPGEGANATLPDEDDDEIEAEEEEIAEIAEIDEMEEMEEIAEMDDLDLIATAQPIAPPANFSDEIDETEKMMTAFDGGGGPDEDFLIDITEMLADDETAREVPFYLPDEDDLTDADLEDEALDLDAEPEDDIVDDVTVPEVVLRAPSGRVMAEDEGMDTPDLLSLDVDEEEEADLESDAARALFEPEEEGEAQPEPHFGYLMPEATPARRPGARYRDDEEEVLKTDFLDFAATFMDEGFVELRWEMEAEMNNRYFSLERSADGKNFTRIDTMNSLSNGKVALRYLRNDTQAPLGTQFYRITYHTKTGEKGYSPIREVFVPEKEHIKFGKLAVFRDAPLPLEFKLNERRNVTLWILTDKGAEVKKFSMAIGPGLVKESVDMRGVPPGTYMARIDASSIRSQRKVVVLR